MGSPRARLSGALLAATGAAVWLSGACKAPTQITIELHTDVKCTDVRGTAISVGALSQLESTPATTVTPACAQGTGRIGSLVIVPSGDRDEQVALRFVMGLGRDPAECVPPAYGPGCVVARRALRFIEGRSLVVPVFLGAVCNGIPCEATQTCAGGRCTTAVIEDSARCEQPGGCDESALGAGAVTPSPDASAPADASPGPVDGGGPLPVPMDPEAACGRPSTYVDDFASGPLGPEWRELATAADSVLVANGALELGAPAGQATSIGSKFAVDLEGDRLRVELPSAPSGTASAVVSLRAPNGDELAFVVDGGALLARQVVGGVATTPGTPYEPVAHRWLQIREAGGRVHWETSPDAITWVERRSEALPAFARLADIVLAVRGGASGGKARFARLNAGRPRAAWCKAGTLTDDFTDGVPATEWRAIAQGACSYREANGELRFSMTGAGVSLCAYESRAAYDLTGSRAYLEIPAITTFYAPVRFFLEVEDASARAASLTFVGTNQLEHAANGLAPVLTPYSAATEDWWRLREQGGTLFWETSNDGQTWTPKRQAAAPFPLDRVRVRIGVRTGATMPGPISIGTPRLGLGGS